MLFVPRKRQVAGRRTSHCFLCLLLLMAIICWYHIYAYHSSLSLACSSIVVIFAFRLTACFARHREHETRLSSLLLLFVISWIKSRVRCDARTYLLVARTIIFSWGRHYVSLTNHFESGRRRNQITIFSNVYRALCGIKLKRESSRAKQWSVLCVVRTVSET